MKNEAIYTSHEIVTAITETVHDPEYEDRLGDVHHDILHIRFGVGEEDEHTDAETLDELRIIYGKGLGENEFHIERRVAYAALSRHLVRNHDRIVSARNGSTVFTEEDGERAMEYSVLVERIRSGPPPKNYPLLLPDNINNMPRVSRAMPVATEAECPKVEDSSDDKEEVLSAPVRVVQQVVETQSAVDTTEANGMKHDAMPKPVVNGEDTIQGREKKPTVVANVPKEQLTQPESKTRTSSKTSVPTQGRIGKLVARKILPPGAQEAATSTAANKLVDNLAGGLGLSAEETEVLRKCIGSREYKNFLVPETVRDKLQSLVKNYNQMGRNRLQASHLAALYMRIGLHEGVEQREENLIKKLDVVDGGEASQRLAVSALSALSTAAGDREQDRVMEAALHSQLGKVFGCNRREQRLIVKHITDTETQSPDLPPELQFSLRRLKEYMSAVTTHGAEMSERPSQLLMLSLGYPNRLPLSVQQLRGTYETLTGIHLTAKKDTPYSEMFKSIAESLVADMMAFTESFEALRLTHS